VILTTGISVEGKNIDGENLGYVYISPNPLNSSKYIVQIGMNKWRNVKGWRLHLPRNGVCDYFIFDLQRPGSGYFEQAWQQAARN